MTIAETFLFDSFGFPKLPNEIPFHFLAKIFAIKQDPVGDHTKESDKRRRYGAFSSRKPHPVRARVRTCNIYDVRVLARRTSLNEYLCLHRPTLRIHHLLPPRQMPEISPVDVNY